MEISVPKSNKIVILKESPAGSGKYDIVLDPGNYRLFIKKVGYFVHQEMVNSKAGICRIIVKV